MAGLQQEQIVRAVTNRPARLEGPDQPEELGLAHWAGGVSCANTVRSLDQTMTQPVREDHED